MVTDAPSNDLFRKFCIRWHRPDDLQRRLFEGVYPDEFELETNQDHLVRLAADRRKVHRQIDQLTSEADRDLHEICGAPCGVSLEGMRAVDNYFTPARVVDLTKRSDPADPNNEYLCLCCELGAYIGSLLLGTIPGSSWFLDWPVWDSCIRVKSQRSFFSVFHWAIKRLSSDPELIVPKIQWAVSESSGKNRPI